MGHFLDDIMELGIREHDFSQAIKELEKIAYHLRDTDQLLMANWMDKAITTIKKTHNEKL